MLKTNQYKIGVFGGSFDPPHYGHLEISKIAIKKLKLNLLLWCITKKNPFKSKTYFSLPVRIKKSKSLIKKNSKIKVNCYENRVKSSRTFNTIKYLKKKYKNAELFLIIGSDNLIQFHKWKSWKELVKLVKIVVFSRKDYDKRARKSVITKKVKNIKFINNKLINISSTEIRKKENLF